MTALGILPRPQLRRDRSRPDAKATARKRLQRARQKSSGLIRLDLNVGQSVIKDLREAARISGADIATEASLVLRRFSARHRTELCALQKRAGALWAKGRPYISYSHFLRQPGTHVRVRERTLLADDWLPIERELSTLFASLGSLGWPKHRIEGFLNRAATTALT